jgi:putative membrane protein
MQSPLRFMFAVMIVGLPISAAAVAQAPATSQSRSMTASQIPTTTFVQRAAESDMFEIQSSKLAQEKSKRSQVLSFAQRMITDHTQSTQKLAQLLTEQNLGVNPPPALDGTHKEALESLRNTPASRFDRSYAEQQVKGHQEALKMMRDYAQSGDNAALKQFAKEMVPTIEEHLDLAKKMAQDAAKS